MIPLMKSALSQEYDTKRALADFIMRANRLSMDQECALFEREFAAFQGSRDAVLFNSGGSANLAMLQALLNLGRLKQTATVLFSALTWSTNVMPILQLGMKPVALDCDPSTLNTSSEQLEAYLAHHHADAFLITNALGFCGDLDKIRDVCSRHNVILLEDNCEALGTELPAGKTGTFGEMASFSFFVAHHMSTIEGGMLCTNDPELSEMLRIVRANGWDRNLAVGQQRRLREKFSIASEFDAKYTFYDLGYNLRPTEITGFLGRNQLQYLPANIRVRESLYAELEGVVAKNNDLVHMNHSHISKLSAFAFPIVCRTPLLRDRYLNEFSGAGVEIRPMIAGNIQRQPFYSKYVQEQQDLPGANLLHDCAFYCGLYPELTYSDVNTLKGCLDPVS